MVFYYLNKVSERLADYRYPIKKGDICMLYDGDTVKTIYVDSAAEADSIWRDFKFIDTKSLKSYHLPRRDSVLCAPIGDKHAIGDTMLLTQLIQGCKGEWLLDFLNETSAVLSGFVDYWDLTVLKRLTGDDSIEIAYGDEEALSAFMEETHDESDNEEGEEVDADLILPKSYDIKWFCLSVLSCIEDRMNGRSYQILYDTLNGEPRSEIASRFHLTQERIRQIAVKATKQAKELLIEQYKCLEEAKEENAKLKVQLNLLREEIEGMKALLPQNVVHRGLLADRFLENELAEWLETPIHQIDLPVRAKNVLQSMSINTFADIPQINNSTQVLRVRNSGRKTLDDITRMLEDFNLSFGMSYADIVDALAANDWRSAKKRWTRGYVYDKYLDKKKGRAHAKATIIPKEKEDEEKADIILTRSIIEAARTPNGGFTKSQLAAIGVSWPAPHDWIEEKVGMRITSTQLTDFNRIEYVAKTRPRLSQEKGAESYKTFAANPLERKRMEAVLQAMTHFRAPATPRDIARTVSRSAWGRGAVNEDTVDSILKLLPEVEYIKWGKYILKSKIHRLNT